MKTLSKIQELTIENIFIELRNNPQGFIIPFSKVWELLGYSQKQVAKRSFLNSFTEVDDYKIVQNTECTNAHGEIIELLQQKDSNIENNEIDTRDESGRFVSDNSEILMSSETFKSWCMLCKTDIGKKVRKYYIELEKRYFSNSSQLIQTQEDQIKATIDLHLFLSDRFETPKHLALQESTKEVKTRFNRDISNYLNAAPACDNIAQKDVYLEPTALGKKHNISARKVNLILFDVGYQTKENDQWMPTEKGEQFCSKHAWAKGSKTGYNLKWKQSKFDELMQDELNNQDDPIK